MNSRERMFKDVLVVMAADLDSGNLDLNLSFAADILCDLGQVM